MSNCIFMSKTLGELKKGSIEEGDNCIDGKITPVWFDYAKFKRGQQFFLENIFSISFSMHCSLVSGFSILNLLEPLVFTHVSDTANDSLKRYSWTFYHIFQWMTGDLFDEKSEAFRSMKTVRNMHRNVARNMNKKFKDKMYVSQYDMGLVQSGFFAAVLMYPTDFGICCTDSQMEDYIYVWRVIGSCLGIDDDYNICTESLPETKALVKEIERQCLIPALLDPPKDFDRMADAYIDGVNLPLPFKLHSKESVLSIIMEGFGMASIYNMTFADQLRCFLIKSMFWLSRNIPGARFLLNKMTISVFHKSMDNIHKY